MSLPLTAVMLCAFLIAGCVSRPTTSYSQYSPRPSITNRSLQQTFIPPRPPLSDRLNRLPPGENFPSRVTGDFAGYSALDQLIERMVNRHGFQRSTLCNLFSQAKRKQWTLDYMSRESGQSVTSSKISPPKPGSWTRYRAQFLTELHLSRGADFWARHASALQRASQRFGVPPEFIIGILGVETVYGANVGKDRVIDALTTLAFDYSRRGAYFTEELENYLLMTRNERLDPLKLVGSYAGAMGLGQFMPSSFQKFAVDMDDDGRRDLWNPVDVIGSIANYLVAHGWRRGELVAVPAVATDPRIKTLEYGLDKPYHLTMLMNYGIRPAATVQTVAASQRDNNVRLLRLGVRSGEEYWLGYENFYVITRYNQSTLYAMAVYQLGQAVKQRYQ